MTETVKKEGRKSSKPRGKPPGKGTLVEEDQRNMGGGGGGGGGGGVCWGGVGGGGGWVGFLGVC